MNNIKSEIVSSGKYLEQEQIEEYLNKLAAEIKAAGVESCS